MRTKRLFPALAFATILSIGAAADVQAQTKAPAALASSSAYDRLSLGNQKVAAALYQAQSSVLSPSPARGARPRLLTLEEIASRRRGGQAWGHIFRDMKSQGLVHERTLGQVVANYLRATADTPSRMIASDSGTKSGALEPASNGSAGGVTYGLAKRGK